MKKLNNVGNIKDINKSPYVIDKIDIRSLKKEFENNELSQLYLLTIHAKNNEDESDIDDPELKWYEYYLIVPLSAYDMEVYLDLLYQSDKNIQFIEAIPLSKVSISFDYQSDCFQYEGVHHG